MTDPQDDAAATTRAEAELRLRCRYRLRVAIALRHEDQGHHNVGATVGETPAELRAAAHRLLDALLDRGVAGLLRRPGEGEP